MLNKVLFICHEASRTGAPLLLLKIISFFKDRSVDPIIVIVTAHDLELLPEFESLGVVIKSWESAQVTYPEDIDLIYSNTVTNGGFVESLPCEGIPVLTHIHELSSAIKLYGRSNFEAVVNQTHHFIACSDSVKNHLENEFGINERCITKINTFIDTIEVDERAQVPINFPSEERGFSKDDILVLGSGWASYRKGTDLFVKLLRYLPRLIDGRALKLVWVGGNSEGYQKSISKEDQSRVYFVGPQENPFSFYKRADIFALTSREDPFPLVMLENMYLGSPVVGFAGSGGVDDIANKGLARTVAPLDVKSMAAEILLILSRNIFRSGLIDKSRKFVSEKCSSNLCLPHIFDLTSTLAEEYPRSHGGEADSFINWSDSSSDSGILAIYYGASEEETIKQEFPRCRDVKGELTIPAVKSIRIDPDSMPGLFTFWKLEVRRKVDKEILYDLSDNKYGGKLKVKGTAVELSASPLLSVLSYGNDPQVLLEVDFDDPEGSEYFVKFHYTIDDKSNDYSQELASFVESNKNVIE
jgi:glycosyltransferase involved in cell wall biosynthesis